MAGRIKAGVSEMTKKNKPPVQLMKFDKGKPRFGLLHPKALNEIARVFTHGAVKYNSWNWMAGTSWERYYSALQRHLNAYWDREDYDRGSGLLHLAHSGCCIMILLVYQLLKIGKDDRPKT